MFFVDSVTDVEMRCLSCGLRLFVCGKAGKCGTIELFRFHNIANNYGRAQEWHHDVKALLVGLRLLFAL